MASISEFIAAKIFRSSKVRAELQVFVARVKQYLSPFVLTSMLKTTLVGDGREAKSYVSACHNLEHFVLFLFFECISSLSE